jgi:signal transduction histidine kinase/CheY-like chemotaxis protein
LNGVVPRNRAARSAVVVTAGDRVIRSSGELDDGAQLAGRLKQPGDATEPYSIDLGSTEYLVATMPLGRTGDGHSAAVHLLRSVTDTLRPLDRALTRSFLFAGLLAVLLVGIGAASASRSLLAPLSRFVEFLRAGSHEPGVARVRYADDRAAVEVQTLIGAYNDQSEALARQHAELARANQDLRAEIGERERAERALRESEVALRQAQKLEALGRLAGGVAHDFNNLLHVIGSATHFLRDQVRESPGAKQDLADIEGATQRATTLVQQLLAFSRKQVLQPRVVVLNEVIVGIEPLVRRLGGPRIEVLTALSPDLAYVRADPGQLEQVLMNLAVNACDAMPDGGTMRIETANVVLERAYENRPEAIPGGPAVMLAVADTGIGMDAETRSRIFEPFFTTKPPGKGTGLGLATVYGIVRQSGGSITVFSEPGQGSTFRIYFPVADSEERFIGAADQEPVTGGNETVLLAEDEEPVRRQLRRFLEGCGYQVLDAASGLEAIEVAVNHAGPIHLLISDFAMPGVSGVELARRLRIQRPDLKAILLSGYSPEMFAREAGEIPWAIHVPKPAEPAVIARTMREVLDGRR